MRKYFCSPGRPPSARERFGERIWESGYTNLWEVDKDQIALVHPRHERIGALPVVVKLADGDCAVVMHCFNIHGVAIVTGVGDGYVANPRIAIYWNTGVSGIIIPEISIAPSAPVRHIAATDRYAVSCPGYALAVIHTPSVDDAVHRGIAPILRINVAAAVLDNLTTAKKRGVGDGLLASQFGDLNIITLNLFVVFSFLSG